MYKTVLFLFLCITTEIGYAQSRQWPPRDETKQVNSLSLFVSDLQEAIGRKDGNFLMQVIDDSIMLAFDGESGKKAFSTMWNPHKPDSPIWPLLSRLISMGGVFLHDEADETGRYQFVFPYVYNMPLELEDDPYSIGVITGSNVNLRETPDTKAPVITRLNYDVITYLYEEDGSTIHGKNEWGEPEWYKIRTIDNTYTGWVFWKYVYSPVGYRMFLYQDADGRWKISCLIAGD